MAIAYRSGAAITAVLGSANSLPSIDGVYVFGTGYAGLPPDVTYVVGDVWQLISSVWTRLYLDSTVPAALRSLTQTFVKTAAATWVLPGIPSMPVIKRFTTSATYTPTVGTLYIYVDIVAAGGGSGGTPAGSASSLVLSGSGGAGGYMQIMLTAAQIGASRTVAVGAAGTAGTTTTAGGAGGNCDFGLLFVATGGSGGQLGVSSGSATSQTIPGATGGGTTLTTGTLVISAAGEAGNPSYASIGGTSTSLMTGNGGCSLFGAGGRGTATTFLNSAAGGAVGAAATGFGSGAAGSSSSGTGAVARAGAAGAGGLVIVTEYF